MSNSELALLQFFNYDELAKNVWYSKYRYGGEITPDDMFKRIITEVLNQEASNTINFENANKLSDYGRERLYKLFSNQINFDYYSKLLSFKALVPGGSMMQGIGNYELYSSLSNCFVLGQPYDSYSGINQLEDHCTQAMKRRGGCGSDLSTIRPKGSPIHNQASYSDGPVLFAEGISNKTIQVAQKGRRGALMLSLHIKHPDSLQFIQSKQDLKKITGANISVKIDDEFMEAVMNDVCDDYLLCFPVTADYTELYLNDEYIKSIEYDTLVPIEKGKFGKNGPKFIKKIHAKEYWNAIIDCAWNTAEPGILFVGNWQKYGTDWYYIQYRPISTNPCGEIPMQAYDSCRLIAKNLMRIIENPFTIKAKLNKELAYQYFYEQLYIADLFIDLEIKHIDNIIEKIKSDLLKDIDERPPIELIESEVNLWLKFKDSAIKGRRCGCGFTALADMLAALNLPYFSPQQIEELFKIKIKAELDATIDLAIIYKPFDGYNSEIDIKSEFIQMVKKEFPEEYSRMITFGRRNVSWSTAAPTGTTSLMTQTTSGVEPLFKPWYKRRKKCITDDERVDYTDPADGQNFTEYFVLHPQFIKWFSLNFTNSSFEYKDYVNLLENSSEKDLYEYFKKSPWYGSCADDLNYEERIIIQSIVQKYTTHSISSTINLPKDIDKNIISDIYLASWKAGLKGNTVYRDGSRGGILVSNEEESNNLLKEFYKITSDVYDHNDRPFSLPAHYYTLTSKGKRYSVLLGFKNENPYEIFIISGLENLPEIIDEHEHIKGIIYKDTDNWYNFLTDTFEIPEISDMEHEEKLISLMISGMMKACLPTKYIIKIIDKSAPIAGSFAFKLNKILAKYVQDGEESHDNCPDCGITLVYENGCVICKNCGYSKC